MGNYSIDQLQQIAGLRILIHNLQEEQKYFAGLLKSLANDQCDIDLNLSIHDLTLCAKNKDRYRVQTLNDDFLFGNIIPVARPHNHCRHQYQVRIDESTALLVINVIAQKKQSDLARYQRELEALLQLNQTPIQQLHNEP
jgi:hypothetical protein